MFFLPYNSKFFISKIMKSNFWSKMELWTGKKSVFIVDLECLKDSNQKWKENFFNMLESTVSTKKWTFFHSFWIFTFGLTKTLFLILQIILSNSNRPICFLTGLSEPNFMKKMRNYLRQWKWWWKIPLW